MRALEGEAMDDVVIAAMLAGDPIELDALLREIDAETGVRMGGQKVFS